MNRLEKIELYFKMPFADVINKLHLEQKRSLLSLSQESGVGRDAFQKQCEKLGLNLRGIKEARDLSALRGENHWAHGLTKETHEMYARHSDRMNKNNPSKNKKTRSKMSKSIAKHFKSNPLPQEIEFEKYLKTFNLKYVFQHPVEQYIADFFLPDFNIVLEVDSTYKWGKDRKNEAEKRDLILLTKGIKTIRFNKALLTREYIFNILKTNNIVS